MKLYEINKEYLELFEKAESLALNEESTEEEMTKVWEALELNENNFNEKALSYCQYISSLESDNESLDKEISRLEALKKPKTNLIKKLKTNLSESLLLLGKDKVDLNLFKLSFRKSKITDTKELESKINEIDTYIYHDKEYNNFLEKMYVNYPEVEYCNVSISVKPDKTLIKKTIDSGKEVFGSKIIENKSLQVK